MRILVLCGGESAERIVSLASGDSVAKWLKEAGHIVQKCDPEAPGVLHLPEYLMAPAAIGLAAPEAKRHAKYDPTIVRALLRAFDEFKPDIVFPILHGGRGEDGTLQALLEWVGMPFTGSHSLSCAMAMNKHHARTAFKACGIPVTEGFVVPQNEMTNADFVIAEIEKKFGFPAVIKPLNGGSTVGLSKVFKPEEVFAALAEVVKQNDLALVEAHFSGRELAATVVDGEAYPLVEIRPKEGFYDYSNKYTSGRTDYICPAELSAKDTASIQESAVAAFRALDCSGFARVDFLLDDDGKFVCLEVNTLPGMTQNSLVPKAARARGEEPKQLMQRILDCALRKTRDGL